MWCVTISSLTWIVVAEEMSTRKRMMDEFMNLQQRVTRGLDGVAAAHLQQTTHHHSSQAIQPKLVHG